MGSGLEKVPHFHGSLQMSSALLYAEEQHVLCPTSNPKPRHNSTLNNIYQLQ